MTQSGTPLLQRKFSWMKAIETCTHSTNLEFLDAFQGMHLRMCGEVLPLGGSDTCDHVWTSPRSYVQRRLLQNFQDHPLLGLIIVLLSLVCLYWMTANESMRIDDGEGWDPKGVCCSYHTDIFLEREVPRHENRWCIPCTQLRSNIVCQKSNKWSVHNLGVTLCVNTTQLEHCVSMHGRYRVQIC